MVLKVDLNVLTWFPIFFSPQSNWMNLRSSAADTKRKKKMLRKEKCRRMKKRDFTQLRPVWSHTVLYWGIFPVSEEDKNDCSMQDDVLMGSERRDKIYLISTTNLQEPQVTNSFLNHKCQVSLCAVQTRQEQINTLSLNKLFQTGFCWIAGSSN